MLTVLAPATAAAQVMLALIVWRQTTLPGHRELSLSLFAGAVYFLYAAFSESLAFLLPVVMVAPLACNRAYRASFGVVQRPLKVDLALALVLIASGLTGVWGVQGWAIWLSSALVLYLFLELPVILWRGLPDDLNAARRSMRYVVLALSGAVGVVVAIASFVGQGVVAQPMAAILILSLCLGVAAFGAEIERRLVPQTKTPLDARETLILKRLREVMAESYSDPDLTLSRLAQKLDVPEHRLRRVIHLGEGQGHFSGYLNTYRLNAFKARADDEATILELALGVGYNSLSAFNRAFKATEGVTPSAFRAARKAKTKAMSEPAPETPSAT